MRIKVKKKDNKRYLDLKDFAAMVDIKRVDSYQFEAIQDDLGLVLILFFYDKDGNIVEVEE